MNMLKVIYFLFRVLLKDKNSLILENLALHQQLAVQQKTISWPRLKHRDRQFWIWLSQLWPQWQSALIIVKPETVIKWHRQGFKT